MRSIPEPEWSPTEQGWMLALAEIERMTCPGCNGDLAETLGTEPEDWVTDPPIRCAKCTRISMQQDDYGTGPNPTKHMQALRWIARRKVRRPRG